MIKIYKWFVNIIFIIIIALLLIYLLFRMTDKVEIYKVKTGSMEEKIHVGDYIMIYRKDSYSVGEIVTYTSNDGFITHRIIRKEGNKIITKGDANNTEDREIAASTIVGKAIFIGGILNIIINYKYVIVCILISMYLFSCYFGKNEKETEEEKENNEEQKEEIKEENSEESINETEIEEKTEKVETKEENEINETIEEQNEKTEEVKEDSKKEEIEAKETKEEIEEQKEEKAKEEIEKVEETLIKKKAEKKK